MITCPDLVVFCPLQTLLESLVLGRKSLIMSRPSLTLSDTIFYPLGNTPAVNLTQCLPPEICIAKVMLAGCGDARNILFTIYNETGDRTLDFTCCDIQPVILARNILLYSLIADGEISNALWDVCFHTSIKLSSLQLLESQARKLVDCAANATTWEHGPYGHFTSFCNNDTLHRVRNVWSEWSAVSLSTNEQAAREKTISEAIRRAQEHKKELGGSKEMANSIRSFAPCGSQNLGLLLDLNELFCSIGSLDSVSTGLLHNPAFLLDIEAPLTIHCLNDPLLGFHLANASNVTVDDPSLRSTHDSVSRHLSDTSSTILKTAQSEFFRWVHKSASFPKEHLDIRFVAADAIAFGQTLQHVSALPGTITANRPTNSWTFKRLDVELFGGSFRGSETPILFDVQSSFTGQPIEAYEEHYHHRLGHLLRAFRQRTVT